jgi:hypothetical protein
MLTPDTTSSHWVVGREGQKARVVEDYHQAWHASEDNVRCWGIEVCQGVEDDGFTDAQYEAVAAICRDYMVAYGVPPVHVHDSREPGFVGHQETLQGKRFGKSDPGHLWDWERFIGLLQPEGEISEMIWMALRDRPEDKVFRSYLGWADREGLKSRFVPNFEEHQALEETHVAGELRFVSIETLRQFKAQPDPLS